MPKPPKRTPRDDRRERFALEYCKDFNATRAAIRAGYAKKAAGAQGSFLLKDPKVSARIAQIKAKATGVAELSIERTLLEIRRLAYQDVRKLYNADGTLKPIHELDDDTAACISGVEVEDHYESSGEEGEKPELTRTSKIKRWDKGKALDQAMSYLGMHKTVAPGGAGAFSLSINLSGKKPRA